MTDVTPSKTPRTDLAMVEIKRDFGFDIHLMYGALRAHAEMMEADLSAAKAELQSSERERLGWYNAASQGRADAEQLRRLRIFAIQVQRGLAGGYIKSATLMLDDPDAETLPIVTLEELCEQALKGVADAPKQAAIHYEQCVAHEHHPWPKMKLSTPAPIQTRCPNCVADAQGAGE